MAEKKKKEEVVTHEDEEPKLRVELINKIVDKLENIIIEWQEKNNVSIWELDNVLLRLHYDVQGHAHTLMHATDDKPNVEFKGSTHLYT